MIKDLIRNWKTTSLGLSIICGAIIHIIFAVRAHTADENSWTILVGAILGGLAAIFAGDSSAGAAASQKNAAAIDQINAVGPDPAAERMVVPPVKPLTGTGDGSKVQP